MLRMVMVAGSNGAGKSTYYTVNNEDSNDSNAFYKSKHINADEILRASGGNWRNNIDNLKAMRQEFREIKQCINNKKNFNFETTLAATPKTYLNILKSAKANGFTTELIYVGVENVDLVKDRINERVKKGGHGIPNALVEKRFEKSLHNLPTLITHFDIVHLYDNTKEFQEIYYRNKSRVKINESNTFPEFRWSKQAIKTDILNQETIKKRLFEHQHRLKR
ncbi:ATPase [Lactobacillus johnsonii]|uniref:zeta toxin family protein n=1 Tax=Lactobacillus johnsonii TaxID=33959 RepID=UPI001093F7BF|nr:zeta toxin family protein [Lactobacillus johnsonii]TGY25862.1 ATPase [Lactobacillus johnsonii]